MFSKLISEADNKFGIGRLVVPHQRDSSLVEEMVLKDKHNNSEELKNSIESYQAHQNADVFKLRALVMHLKQSNSSFEDVASEHAYNSSISSLTSKPERNLPILMHWEVEAKNIMENTVDENEESSQGKGVVLSDDLFIPYSRLPDVIVPPSCFFSEEISENVVDPLESLIPNASVNEASNDSVLSTESIKAKELIRKSLEVVAAAKLAESASPVKANAPTSITGNKDLTAAERRALLAKEKKKRLMNVNMGTEAVKSLDRIFGSKRGDGFSSSGKRRGRSVVSSLSHATIATTHKNSKPDLKESELKYFHHPRLIYQSSFTIQIKQECKTKPSQSTGPVRELVTAQAERQNVSLETGKVVIVEFIEERPPIIQNVGMASAIINYVRQGESDLEGDALPMKEGQQAHSKSKMWSLIETIRLPRHVLLLLKQGENKELNLQLENSFVPQSDIGERMVLSIEEPSPFLGNISANSSQPAIVNNLFKAPLFRQDTTLSHDYIMVPVGDDKQIKYVLRSMSKVFVAGQTEPQLVIPRPVENITVLQEKFYLLAAARCFARMSNGLGFQKGISYSSILKYILKYCADEHRSPHKSHHREKLKLILSKVGTEVREGNETKWYPKDFYEIAESSANTDGLTVAELERMYSEGELAKAFTAEEVCLQESCNAAEYLLRDAGIFKDLDLATLDEWIQRMQRLIALKEDQYLFLKQKKQTAKKDIIPSVNRLMKIKFNELKKLYEYINVGNFIQERLVKAPWNTTEAFNSCVVEKANSKVNLNVMDVTSPDCDPSGIGEGFSYRNIAKAPAVRSVKQQKRLQGTDADLRKLTNPELISMLSKFGVDPRKLKTLERWDMVHLLRDLMNQTAVGGLVPSVLQKFVRQDGVFGSALNESIFKQKCQDIWERQAASLQYLAEDGEGKIDLVNSVTVVGGNESLDDIEVAIEKSLRIREDKMLTTQTDDSKAAGASSSSIKPNKAKKEEDAELKNLDKVLEGFSEDTKPSNRILSRVLSSAQDDTEPKEQITSQRTARPVRVVKRVTKFYLDDGNEITERVKVEFISSELEVRRVEEQTIRDRKLREMKRNPTSRVRGTHSGRHMSFDDDAMDEDQPYLTSSGTLGLNLGVLKRKAADEHIEDELYARVHAPSKRNKILSKNFRLPRVELAARFEEEVLELWNMKSATLFRYPVPRDVPGYYDLIANPVCLKDIRERIAEYKYASAKALLDDVALMADNAEKFNGKQSDIAKNGRKLVSMLKVGLSHDRKHFDEEGDMIKILEEAIQKKESYSRKPSGLPKQSSSANRVPPSTAAPIVETQEKAVPRATETKIPATLESRIPPPPQIAQTDTSSVPPSLPSIQLPTPPPPPPTNIIMSLDDSSGDEEIIEEG